MNRATLPLGVMRVTEKEPYLRSDNSRYGAAGGRLHRARLTGADASRKSVAGNAAARVAGQLRLEEYRHALWRHGIAPREEGIFQGALNCQTGKAGLNMLISRPHPPAAIFCPSDMISLEALAKVLGLRVPEELSLTGVWQFNSGSPLLLTAHNGGASVIAQAAKQCCYS